MFKQMLEHAEKELERLEEPFEYSDVIELATRKLITSLKESEDSQVKDLIISSDEFIKNNRERWKVGFTKLHALRNLSLEAGIEFQKQFLSIPEYETDPLLGVLMRQHANSCRITGEIIHLLEGGYPDAALARWRTLYEIAVTCLVIQKYGNGAAIEYIKHGKVKAVEGMEEYQKTAYEMGLKPYSEEEMNKARNLKEKIIKGKKHYHWALEYTGFSKLDRLREDVGLGKWSHNYKWASRGVHADYREMLSLSAMSEAKNDGLLVGPSNSGLTEPAHFTAITLSQITSAFLFAYSQENTKLNYTNSIMFMNLISHYSNEVGDAFLHASQL